MSRAEPRGAERTHAKPGTVRLEVCEGREGAALVLTTETGRQELLSGPPAHAAGPASWTWDIDVSALRRATPPESRCPKVKLPPGMPFRIEYDEAEDIYTVIPESPELRAQAGGDET